MDTNVLYYGDNLDILSGSATDAQLLAFEDTWHWGPSPESCYLAMMRPIRRPVVFHS